MAHTRVRVVQRHVVFSGVKNNKSVEPRNDIYEELTFLHKENATDYSIWK